MNIEFYQIDSFTNNLFKGNPAGVCPLTEWLPEDVMQNIAFENNLSETAFYVKTPNGFDIRFFTPTSEIALCGHATLATAFVEFELKNNTSNELSLTSKGGHLKVTKESDQLLCLDFPTTSYKKIPLTEELKAPFKPHPIEAFETELYTVLIFKNTDSIKNLEFDLSKINQLPTGGVSVSAPGVDYDFVSRFFTPQSGINEDPVTGSAHTFLTPLWASKLNKNKLIARQVSPRGGELTCEINNDRILISGTATLFMKGTIILK